MNIEIKEAVKHTPIQENETAKQYYVRIAELLNKEWRHVQKTYRAMVRKGLAQTISSPWYGPENTEGPTITGVTIQSDSRINFERDLLPELINLGKRALHKRHQKRAQSVEIPRAPFMIALMSDLHGGGKIDYEQLKADLEIIKRTNDCYVVVAGDVTDNFIIGKLEGIQKLQPTTHEIEVQFARWFTEQIRERLIVWVMGNHDNWTYKVAGVDPYKYYLRESRCLYDRHEIDFDLCHNYMHERWIVRHKWRNGSIFNPTHGIEVAWERMGLDFDVAIGGHTHIATLHREFIKHDRKRSAVLLGTYKILDEYGKEVGFANTHSQTNGSGAFVYGRDFRRHWFDSLSTAQSFLKYLQNTSK